MQNSIMLFTFSVLGSEYRFCASFVQKIKIVSLSWNLVLRLIQIWRIQWWYSFFPLLTGIVFGNLLQKINIVCWSYDLEPRLILICRIRWWFSFLFFVDQKYPFLVNLVQKFKIVSLSWNVVPKTTSNIFFVQKIYFVFWSYVINLPAVYSQWLETNGFCCC